MAKIAEGVPVSMINPADMVQRASAIRGEDPWWTIYGPPGHGKTVTSASASAKFKLGQAETIFLDDIIYWQFDKNGTDSLGNHKLDTNVFDLSKMSSAAQLKAGIKQAGEVTKALGVHSVIIDTFTTLNKVLLADLAPKYGKEFGLYAEVLSHHGATLGILRQLGVNVIFVCHSKAKMSFKAGTEFAITADLRSRAADTPGDSDIQLDLTGDTLNFLRGQSSCVFPVIAEQVGNREPDYAVYPYGYPGFEYKCRYKCFEKKEKPSLYRMMQLVKKST